MIIIAITLSPQLQWVPIWPRGSYASAVKRVFLPSLCDTASAQELKTTADKLVITKIYDIKAWKPWYHNDISARDRNTNHSYSETALSNNVSEITPLLSFKQQPKGYLFHIWWVNEHKKHSRPPGAVVHGVSVIPAPVTKLQSYLLTE